MRKRLSSRTGRVSLAVMAVIALFGMSGCKTSGGFSKEEEQQLKQGPPQQMPPEAKQTLEKIRKGELKVPPPPPRPKGQPGPGSPFGSQ